MGALCVVLCDAGTVHDIVFEQIDVLDERANGINCMLFRDRWSTDTQAGHIRAICFRDISLPKNVSVRLWGYDAAHRVEDILLQNVHMEEAEAPWLDSNVYTSEIQVRGTRNE